ITDYLKDGENTLSVTVTDPSDTGNQSKGKQKLKRGGIFYTPQSGIWQTVWLESVAKEYIKSIKITPDIDSNSVHIAVSGIESGEITIFDGDKLMLKTAFSGGKASIPFADYTLWSPEQPKLYDMQVTAGEDTVKSYFGMRKFGLMLDTSGYMRLALNNQPYFHNGLLDQGYFSDGLYTPPSDEAMVFDIQTTKDMGFNMLRKHIKIEPLRWYYHCDRLGVLVWQDMINGGDGANNLLLGATAFVGGKINDSRYSLFGRSDAKGREEYYIDTKRTVELLYNTVSLALWVPFNESWGQFDAIKAYDFVKELDNTRPIDHASGWFDQGGGDFKSLHIYFRPITIGKDDRAIILSEFGGFSVKVEGHIYNLKRSFGYRKFKSLESFENAYHKLYEQSVIPNIKQGLAATVYTQITDVEDEINGLITYDRAVIKVDLDRIRELNKKLTL
ncbi:MAG: glycoside hydrolase family 2 TIM barrel-domain containing protein, partial [Clostridia bacterium]